MLISNESTRYTRPMSFPRAFNQGGNQMIFKGLKYFTKQKIVNRYRKSTETSLKQFSDELANIGTLNFGGTASSPAMDTLLHDISYVDPSRNQLIYPTSRVGMFATTQGRQFTTQGQANSSSQDTNFHNRVDMISYENPYHFAADALHSMNTYKYANRYATKVPLGAYLPIEKAESNEGSTNNQNAGGQNGKVSDSPNIKFVNVPTTLSMFNPNYNVQIIGMSNNTPLLTDTRVNKTEGTHSWNSNANPADTTSDCSIRTLVALSNAGALGMNSYRFADFMYCEELGTMSNNHLITLRKFSLPVGDHISFGTTRKHRMKSDEDIGNYDVQPNTGQLVTWFGTSHNKLEDILNYSYKYTWKDLKSKIQQLPSQEDDPARGLIGKIGNFLNPSYNNATLQGLSSGGLIHDALSWATNKLGVGNIIGDANPNGSQDAINRLRNYDNNKVYTPLQTIQDMTIPEGQLVFSHEFSLTFSYKLRAYENINPKSAFLDLLNNILKVTYFDGKFWGGKQEILGPKPNHSAYRKAYHMIDNAFDKIGNFMSGIADGSIDGEYIMGMLSNLLSSAGDLVNDLKEKAKETIAGHGGGWEGVKSLFGEGVRGFVSFLQKMNNRYNITNGIKGVLRNAMGRPSFYMFDSLLSGNATGLWHVTIGNPRNPIVAFGNLIMTDASVQHTGPLGLDDFPTGLRVTVKLKHGRSRDAASIGKMYTSGFQPLSFSQQYNSYETSREEDTSANSVVLKEGEVHVWDEKARDVLSAASATYASKLGGGNQQAQQKGNKQTGTNTVTLNSAAGDAAQAEANKIVAANYGTGQTVESLHNAQLNALSEYLKSRVKVEGGEDTLWNDLTYVPKYPSQAMLFHNGSDNVVAVMTAADQDSVS